MYRRAACDQGSRHEGNYRFVVPIAAGPALVALLRTLELFDLVPLAHWTFDATVPKFLLAGVGALVAYAGWMARHRTLTAILGVIVFVVALYVSCLRRQPRREPACTAPRSTSHRRAAGHR